MKKYLSQNQTDGDLERRERFLHYPFNDDRPYRHQQCRVDISENAGPMHSDISQNNNSRYCESRKVLSSGQYDGSYDMVSNIGNATFPETEPSIGKIEENEYYADDAQPMFFSGKEFYQQHMRQLEFPPFMNVQPQSQRPHHGALNFDSSFQSSNAPSNTRHASFATQEQQLHSSQTQELIHSHGSARFAGQASCSLYDQSGRFSSESAGSRSRSLPQEHMQAKDRILPTQIHGQHYCMKYERENWTTESTDNQYAHSNQMPGDSVITGYPSVSSSSMRNTYSIGSAEAHHDDRHGSINEAYNCDFNTQSYEDNYGNPDFLQMRHFTDDDRRHIINALFSVKNAGMIGECSGYTADELATMERIDGSSELLYLQAREAYDQNKYFQAPVKAGESISGASQNAKIKNAALKHSSKGASRSSRDASNSNIDVVSENEC